MQIRFRRSSKTEQAIAKSVSTLPPATPEQRIQATRIMGKIGYVLIFGFLLTIGYAVYANSKTIGVKGTVVSSRSEISTRRGGYSFGYEDTVYWHRFSFTDADGTARFGETFGSGKGKKYPNGKVLSIGYDPEDPSKVRLRNWFVAWQYQLTLLGLGIVLVLFSNKAVAIIKQEEADKAKSKNT